MNLPFETTSSLLKYVSVCAIWSHMSALYRAPSSYSATKRFQFSSRRRRLKHRVSKSEQITWCKTAFNLPRWVNVNEYFMDGITSVSSVGLNHLFWHCAVRSVYFSHPKMTNFTGHNIVCYMAAALNVSNVYFYHAFENGRLPSGRIIRCGTCGWILKQF